MSYQTVALINDGDVTVSFEFPDKRRGGVDLVPVETLDEGSDGIEKNEGMWAFLPGERKLFAEHIRRLDRRIAQLQALRDNLDGCIGCGCLSLKTCKLYNPDDIAAEGGPGPRVLR